MPRKKRRKSKGLFAWISVHNIFQSLGEETKHGVLSVVFFVLAVFFLLATFGYAGVAGDVVHDISVKIFGTGLFLLPIVLIFFGVSFARGGRPNIVLANFTGGILFIISSLGIFTILFGQNTGGLIGNIVSTPLLRFFDVYASILFLIALSVISILIIFNTRLRLPSFSLPKRRRADNLDAVVAREEEREEEDNEAVEESQQNDGGEEDEGSDESMVKKVIGRTKRKDEIIHQPTRVRRGKFTPPPLSILERDSGRPGVGDIKANANIIKRTLANFGIQVEVDEVSVGPSITRYAIKPAEGVRLSRIVGLQNDLSLALAAHPIRIEAPIPGKSLVGIEIPNSRKTTVGLASLLSAKEFTASVIPLLIVLGRNVAGIPRFANLANTPHILIAGATGAGKSVTVHAIVTSLLYRNPPENVRFIMIDPKRVELTLYNNIPHLLTPVITDSKKAVLALKWAIGEMERRYNILEAESVRDVTSYHKNILMPAIAGASDPEEDLPPEMPYIIIVIDELADIMSVYSREFESAVVRLAQMSRAVGIHLILSTQRPSVDIITGLIKANIPTRIALQVSSQVDSRTILDAAGAEKLLGSGDMLYLSGEMSKPERLQSAFISETEVKKVVKFLASTADGQGLETIDLGKEKGQHTLFGVSLPEDEEEDELYEEARELVINAGKASTSYLQRKLKIGYARAARLIDILEERGVVGPGEGAKPREVYEKRPPPPEPLKEE